MSENDPTSATTQRSTSNKPSIDIHVPDIPVTHGDLRTLQYLKKLLLVACDKSEQAKVLVSRIDPSEAHETPHANFEAAVVGWSDEIKREAVLFLGEYGGTRREALQRLIDSVENELKHHWGRYEDRRLSTIPSFAGGYSARDGDGGNNDGDLNRGQKRRNDSNEEDNAEFSKQPSLHEVVDQGQGVVLAEEQGFVSQKRPLHDSKRVKGMPIAPTGAGST